MKYVEGRDETWFDWEKITKSKIDYKKRMFRINVLLEFRMRCRTGDSAARLLYYIYIRIEYHHATPK